MLRSWTIASWLLFFAGADWAGATTTDPAGKEDLRADALVVTGKVTYLRDDQPWAVSSGEYVPLRKVIKTGDDGYGHFRVTDGDTFDIFANSQVLFRGNTGNAGDLLDVQSGRVRVHLGRTAGERQQRIFTPSAIIIGRDPAGFALAVDEEGTVRIDVTEGEIRVQHALLPRSEPVIVRAVDAIVVRPNETVSRRVDRGTLYRYTVKIWSALTWGHSGRDGEPIEGNHFLKLNMIGRPLEPFRLECPENPPLQ
ncbi:MAG: hypothetical protein ACJ74Y_01490 [Bryobacteraceae bacterium]